MEKKILVQLFIVFIALTSCIQNGRYGKISPAQANWFLSERTKRPWFGHLEEVIELVEKGANLEYGGMGSKASQRTPFLNAAGALDCLMRQKHLSPGKIDSMEMEAVKIVKYLASKGANIHAKNGTSQKLNALHLAACGGREKMIPVLVELGLDINSRDSTEGFGSTVLLHAIAAGDLATVKAVVESGADINLCSLDGNSPLDWAMKYAHPKSKGHLWLIPYRDQQAIADYMQSIGAKHGANNYKGYLYFDHDNNE